MKRLLCAWLMGMLLSLPVHATQAGPGGMEADGAGVGEVSRSLEDIAIEVRKVLVAERVHGLFDLMRKFQEYGVTWQPDLLAPDNLVDKLDEEQLRLYAGMKLFDAIYAATFLQRQAVTDAARTIEGIQDRLDLRSYADVSGSFFITLNRAAAEPDSVDVPALLAELTENYVHDIPALMSSPESADYLIDGFYGFFIQMEYVMDSMYAVAGEQMEIGFELVNNSDIFLLVLDLFAAFDRMDEEIRLSGETVEKLDVVKRMHELDMAENDGILSDEESHLLWEEQGRTIRTIRTAILTPSAG